MRFFVCAGPFQDARHTKKISGLITHYFGGNRTLKLGNSDFETTSKQGLSTYNTTYFVAQNFVVFSVVDVFHGLL